MATSTKKNVGMTGTPPKANAKGGGKKKKPKDGAQALPGLTSPQNQTINQRQEADLSLGNTANKMLPAIEGSYAQPFDWNSLPANPVTGDYNKWVGDQMQQYNSAFDARMNPVYQQQSQDFEQMAANRGWTPGSENYNREKTRLEQSQNEARQQAYAANQSNAVSSAGQLFNIGTSAHSNALSDAMTQRNLPLTEFNALYAARAPYDMQNLGYAQQKQLQQDKFMQDRWMMQHTPRGGGGGGGGGGGYAWQQYGFGSPQEYDAYQDARKRAEQQFAWQNDPRYRTSSGPSMGSQLLGGVLGVGSGILGGYLGGMF